MKISNFRFSGDEKVKLDDLACKFKIEDMTSDEISAQIAKNVKKIGKLQDRLYSEKKEGLLIIFQAMDAAGKDGTIRHVMSGINPQGIDVYSFKSPSAEELAHDYLWRITHSLPERGKIAIFNRSYYEDVLVVKVRELYKTFSMPDRCLTDDIFTKRYKHITNLEEYLWDNGIRVVKVFLHLSAEEQRSRLISRIDDQTKNWKFSKADIAERQYWDDYQKAYQKAINETATKHAPWYIVPADKKPTARLIVSEIVLKTLQEMNPQYPEVSEEIKSSLQECKTILESSKN